MEVEMNTTLGVSFLLRLLCVTCTQLNDWTKWVVSTHLIAESRRTQETFILFFLSWGFNTQLNRWTKRVVHTRLTT